MAHGSKKWIVAYDGHIKRSNDRTKKDFYRDLKWWDADYRYYNFHRKRQTEFCPQCRHVAKAALAVIEENKNLVDEYRKEYDEIFGHAAELWQNYEREFYQFWNDEFVARRKPRMEKPPHFYDWIRNEKDFEPHYGRFDERNFLCFKHERMMEVKDDMWWSHPNGEKDRYGYTVRQEYKEYRNEVRNIMKKAKYDEDYYDAIPPKKLRGWLD